MKKDNKTKNDEIGRPIPDWSEVDLFITVKNGHYNMNSEEFLRSQKTLLALTDPSQSGKKEYMIRCRLANGSKILNFNDRKDYNEIKRLCNADDIEDMDNESMKFISMGGYAGVFCPTRAGVKICDPAVHLVVKSLEKEH